MLTAVKSLKRLSHLLDHDLDCAMGSFPSDERLDLLALGAFSGCTGVGIFLVPSDWDRVSLSSRHCCKGEWAVGCV